MNTYAVAVSYSYDVNGEVIDGLTIRKVKAGSSEVADVNVINKLVEDFNELDIDIIIEMTCVKRI